jgi:hypothetical protein
MRTNSAPDTNIYPFPHHQTWCPLRPRRGRRRRLHCTQKHTTLTNVKFTHANKNSYGEYTTPASSHSPSNPLSMLPLATLVQRHVLAREDDPPYHLVSCLDAEVGRNSRPVCTSSSSGTPSTAGRDVNTFPQAVHLLATRYLVGGALIPTRVAAHLCSRSIPVQHTSNFAIIKQTI